MKKVSLLILICLFMMSVTVSSADFADQPFYSHWVYENFELLNELGLIEGYPDGSFQGDKEATRYEMVELSGRVLKYLEQGFEEQLASLPLDKTQLLDTIQLPDKYDDELKNLNFRVTTLEEENELLQDEIKMFKNNEFAKDEKIEDLSHQLKQTRLMAIAGIILGLAGLAN